MSNTCCRPQSMKNQYFTAPRAQIGSIGLEKEGHAYQTNFRGEFLKLCYTSPIAKDSDIYHSLDKSLQFFQRL